MKIMVEIDDFLFLNEKEFEELENKEKWNYVNSLLTLLKDKQIMVDKNCGECIYRLQTKTDINLELFFEDWRSCSDNCDECNIETLKEMCHTQFDIMNHISNSLVELQMKQNISVPAEVTVKF